MRPPVQDSPGRIIVLLIPLIRSYVSVPMIISRYFIVVLPAILLIISVGITQFKNKIIQYAFIFMLFIFTISDIVFVKNYYFNTTKSQFREGSNFIIENNSNKTKVVTSLGWYFKHFLQNKKVNYELIDKSLDNYVDEIKLDTTKIQAFWYIDAHGRTYNPTQTTIDFLDKYFYVEKNLNAHDVWVKKYELKNVVWLDNSTNSAFGGKEMGIRVSEKEIIPIRFGESNLSLNQGGVLYAQQQMALYLVSLKSLQFWENILKEYGLKYYIIEESNLNKRIDIS